MTQGNKLDRLASVISIPRSEYTFELTEIIIETKVTK